MVNRRNAKLTNRYLDKMNGRRVGSRRSGFRRIGSRLGEQWTVWL